MKRSQAPQLDGCEKVPLRFKDVPCENMHGQPIGRCKMCDGSGATCKGEKRECDKTDPSAPPHFVYANFNGNQRNAYSRKGYAVTCEPCSACRGAGLVVEGGK